MRKINYSLFFPVTIIIVNLIVKGLFITSNSVAGDEPFSIYIAQMSFSSIVKNLSTGNNPPLFELLLHIWIKLFGISALSVRMPSLIFSSVTVYFVYKLSDKFINRNVAIISSLIFTLSNYQVLFAHEARTYALVGMLTVMSMYYYINIITSKKTKIPYFSLFCIVNVLLVYAHYFGFFILILQAGIILTNRELLKKYYRQLLFGFLLVAGLYTPNIKVLFERFSDTVAQGTWVQAPSGIVSIYNMLWDFSNAPVVTVCNILILLTALLKFFISKPRKTDLVKRIIVIWFIFPFFLMFGISYWLPMFLDRYLIIVSVAFYLLVSISAVYLIGHKKYKYIVPVLICLLYLGTFKPNISNKRDVKEVVEKVSEIKTNRTIMFMCPSWFELNFVYYYNQQYFKNFDSENLKLNIYKSLNGENIFPIDNQSQIDINNLIYFDKILYIDAAADFSFPDNGIMDLLSNNFELENKFEFYEIFRLYEFINPLKAVE